MWLSKRLAERPAEETHAELGVTTVAGSRAGVLARGEVRQLPVFGPGGMVWLPRDGDTVLVVKGGTGGEEGCVAGAEQTAPAEMAPGEVYLHCDGGSIWLRRGGRVEICGALYVNGEKYEPCGGIL